MTTAAALLLVLWLLTAGWYTTVAVAGVVVLLVAVRRHRRAARIRDAGLRARADYEHRLSLAGDPRGTFGRYPPMWSQTFGQ
ncbi:hypothetical protein [Mycobacterium deserti]|uniref:Uncharacterized protein n=1 Tax=Mycobacterium deserti TaxID=2978347 RepID=A0ABT2M5V7_9MYCO|nr:hypothetical protein [Mycobacterium deserti]MCT7657648.1 hypothetical protein [Mycobacterium deserti]